MDFALSQLPRMQVEFHRHVVPKHLWFRVELPLWWFVYFIKAIGSIPELKWGRVPMEEEFVVVFQKCIVISLF